MLTFSEEVFDMFTLKVSNFPTLPSLGFAIYRAHFMPLLSLNENGSTFDPFTSEPTDLNDLLEQPAWDSGVYHKDANKRISAIPQLPLSMFNDLYEGYIGGVVDYTKAQLEDGYMFDVNSLYPFAMLNVMPIGTPKLVIGGLRIDKILYGIYNAVVEAPELMDQPLLPSKDGGTVSCPLGKFEGW